MENKTTIELLNEFDKLNPESDPDGEQYGDLMAELRTRDPFVEILDEAWEGSLADLQNQVNEVKADIKLLKRHKHDPNNGDVLARI